LKIVYDDQDLNRRSRSGRTQGVFTANADRLDLAGACDVFAEG
jgi:hypothetical protein